MYNSDYQRQLLLGMGQAYPHSNFTTYPPTTALNTTPGQPQLLINNGTLIEQYQIRLTGSEAQLEQQRSIYQQRRLALPWHVGVVGWHLDKAACHCLHQQLNGTVQVQHLPLRLAHYPTAHATPGGLPQLNQKEAVFVLVNALQGYRLLSDKYVLSYPTAGCIGLSSQGLVKVWLEENFSLNRQAEKPLPEHLLIEEIINLVAERTEPKALSSIIPPHYYLNLTFESAISLLTTHTIEYHQGHQELQRSIKKYLQPHAQQLQKPWDIEQLSRKQTLNKVKSHKDSLPPQTHEDIPLLALPEAPTDRTLERKVQIKFNTDRSQQSSQGLIERKTSHTPQTSLYSSPRRTLRFTYQPNSPHRPPSLPQSPPQETKALKFSPKQLKFHKRQTQNTTQHQFFPHKLNTDTFLPRETRNKTKGMFPKAPRQLNVFLEQGESRKTFKRTEESRGGDEDAQTVKLILQSQRSHSSFSSKSRLSPLTPTRGRQSLSEVTAEFRLLLQSDKRLQKQSPCSVGQLSLSQESQGGGQEQGPYRMFNKRSQECFEVHCYAIRQVDEQVSLSVEDIK